MTEFELLEELLKTEKEIESLEMKLEYSADKEDSETHSHLKDSENKRSSLEILLINIVDKSKSKDAYNTIIAQVVEHIRNFESINKSYRLDRNQASVIENKLFSMILQDIYHIATATHSAWVHVNQNILCTTEEKGSVETAVVIDFLKNELIILRQLETINYVELKKYYNDLKGRMEVKFV